MDGSFIEAVKAIYEKGKELASKQYRQHFFEVAETPSYMKELGLRGDKFTISYGTISKHIGKDKAHRLSEDVWLRLPEAINPQQASLQERPNLSPYPSVREFDGKNK